MRNNLTKRQAQVLSAIAEYMNDKGYAPSVREIGDIVHLASASTVYRQLENLKEKGYITWVPTQPRTLRILNIAS